MKRSSLITTWLALHLLIAALPAAAHHFKGLPHFNYFENYPQVPQDEFIGQQGDYEFCLVVYDFQGIQKEMAEMPDDARLYLVIYNLRQNKVYSGPLTMDLLDRDRLLHQQHFKTSEEESIYALQQELPESGRYSLRVTMGNDAPGTVLIPFTLSSQKIRWGRWVLITAVLIVAVVALGARRARVIQDRRANARQHREQCKVENARAL